MKFHQPDNVRVILPELALGEIFDECDRFDYDETGGRVIGTFEEDLDALTLTVSGIIESGPGASRTATSFFQDGDYQEPVFRQVEQSYPDIEHLGNWHTHHVNGLHHLSNGDIPTYRRIVNHPNHNTSFFYALLVVQKNHTKNPLERYSIKHYLFRQNDDRVYEIPSSHVEIVDSPLVWPLHSKQKHKLRCPDDLASLGAQPTRVYDRDIIAEFYHEIRGFSSKKLGLYWKGPLNLISGSTVQVVLVEDSTSVVPSYSILLRETPSELHELAGKLHKRQFPSARSALIETERVCNHALYEHWTDKKLAD